MLTVVGENTFQTTDPQISVAMKRLKHKPKPYPFGAENNNECCNDELDDQEANAGINVFGLAVESCENVDGLSQGNDEGENDQKINKVK